MLIILFSVVYSEYIWYLVESNKRPYKDMDRLLKFVFGLNYILAITLESEASFMFALICSLYQIVIFKSRISKKI